MDERRFRDVLGLYPTGVVAITSATPEGPVGMIVGTFSSVSIDPPLVAYMPSRSSTSYARLKDRDTFCVSVLSSRQEDVCRALSARAATDKFAGIALTDAPSGNPVIRDSMAWIDCTVETIVEAGDHDIVIGRVTNLGEGTGELPLLFLGGGYGGFTPHARVIPATDDITSQLQLADAARPHLEDAAAALDVECSAIAIVGDDAVRFASAGTAHQAGGPTPVGTRMPLQAPVAAVLVAWADRPEQERWVRRADKDVSAEDLAAYLAALDRIRERGWTASLNTTGFDRVRESLQDDSALPMDGVNAHDALGGAAVFDPPLTIDGPGQRVRNVTVPVFVDGQVPMYLVAFGFAESTSGERVRAVAERLKTAAARTSASLPPKLSAG